MNEMVMQDSNVNFENEAISSSNIARTGGLALKSRMVWYS